MTRKKRQGRISLPKLVAIVTFTLLAVLMVDFGRKALENYQIQRQVAWLDEQVEQERRTNEALQEELEYVSSDPYVVKIARERLKLVKPGERAVVVLPLVVEAPSPATDSTAAAMEGESVEPYWRQWADLLLGGE